MVRVLKYLAACFGIMAGVSSPKATPRRFLQSLGAAFLSFLLAMALAGEAAAQTLVLNNVGAPTSVGTGVGKRAIWVNAGTVGGTTVDLVATLNTTTLNHTWSTQTSRAALTSVGVEDVWMTWRIFQAGTYDINTDSGGVPVIADIHVQLNDIDGPNNERAYVPICDGTVSWVRVQKTATTGRAFGTITGRPQIFSLIGDRSYNSEPESGVEVFYPATSTFSFGRRANNGFFIRVSSPTYTAFDTFDYGCADFGTPVAVDDTVALVPGPNTVAILQNDSVATNSPTGNPSEWAMQAVSLTAPPGATGIVTDASGHTVGFTIPNQGTWTFDDTTGLLTFTPDPVLVGSPTPIAYVFYNALTPAPGIASNAATVTLTSPLVATNDTPPAANGSAGNPNVGNIFTNDTAGGDPVDPANLTTTILAQTSPDVTLDPVTGDISVAPGTPAGTYTIDYQICEVTVPTNCSTSTVTVTVVAGTLTVSNDGPFPINGTTGSPNVVNAYTNDTLSGAPVNVADVTGTILAQTSPNVTLDPATGMVSVAPNTPAGSYTIDYQLCEDLNPTNCTTGIITVTVTAATVDATDDTPGSPANGYTGNPTVMNIYDNDTLNGTPMSPSDVTTTIQAQTSPNVTLDPATGIVSVAPGTPAGPYTITYQACQVLNPANCDTATVTVTVTAPPVDAIDDTPASAGGLGGNPNVINIFANDTLNGAALDPADVVTSIVAQTSPNVTLDVATGIVSVAPKTLNNKYTITYSVCDTINPANCDTAIVTVTVTAPAIDAVDDTPASANGFTGNANLVNVFTNDTLGGSAVNPADLNVQVTTPASNPNVQMNVGTGVVSVAPGTPAGSYTIVYEICERTNPTNCDSATVTVTVGAPAIDAADDAPGAVNGAAGNANAINAFANDTLNGAAVNPAAITASIVTPSGSANVQLDVVTGTVSVAPGTPAATYTIGYRICENLNPANCNDATITVVVNAAAIVAGDDAPPAVSGVAGDPNVVNALANDTLNGAGATTASVTLSVLAPAANAGVQLDTATGTVSVAPGTPAAIYTIDYRICENLNPANCDDAIITVAVTAATINAVNDNPAAVDGVAGNTNVANAFANDTLAGAPLDPATTTATITAQTSPNVTLDVTTGTISVAPGTVAGTYTITYQVCEDINPTNCDSAVVTVSVTGPVIDAVDDNPAAVSGSTGNVSVVNVLANDTLGGSVAATSTVTLSVVTPAANAGVQLDTATGNVAVTAGTPQSNYTIVYQICETADPANCDTATVTIPVVAAVVDAVDDTPPTVFSGANNTNIGNAFANDTLGGNPVSTATVTATILTPASNPNVQMDPATGTISVGATVPAGSYTIDYRICETLNPVNCDTAVITVTVSAPAIRAVDDTPPAVVGGTGSANAGDAFANDTLNGAPVSPSQITATILTPASDPNVTMNVATGVISVGATVPAGTYTIDYQICETLNPANCDTAIITVQVDAPVIDAVDDTTPLVNSATGNANAINAFANDTLNGAPVVASAITATVVTPASNANVQFDVTTGNVSVAAGTPTGSYTIGYEICENLNPANCDTATITVTVGQPAIDAVDDTAPAVNSATGNANAINVFANDTLNGAPVVASAITATVMTPAANSNVQLDVATGVVSVATGTPAETYTIGYRICENINPTNCDTAFVTVQVNSSAIDAVDDTVPTPFDTKDPITGALNVLGGDTLNGAPATTGAVTVSAVGTLPVGFILNASGSVDIAQGTASGTYTFDYRICEILNPANCDTATVTIEVRKSTPSISGYVFFDLNGNGVLDPGEDRLPGYEVELRRNGQVIQTTVSGSDGSYHFTDFPTGSGYEIVFIDPDTDISVGRIPNLDIDDDTTLVDQNQPIDPSGLVYDVSTGTPVAGVTLEMRTQQGTLLPDACLLPHQQRQTTAANGRYRFDVVAGAAAACPVGRTQYDILVTGYPQGYRQQLSLIAPPEAGALDAGTCPQDAVPGGACQLSPLPNAPNPGAPTPYYLSFLIASGDRDVVNNHIPLDPVVPTSNSGLSITKRANVAVAHRDDVISYVIVAANDNAAPTGPVEVRDRLPAGLAMVPGSASVDGVATTPIVNGRSVTFAGLTIAPNDSIEIRLSVRIGADASPGDYVNQAWITDAITGEASTPIARATVRITAEAAFDCGEVIGKVFDDRNRDGVQNEGEKGLPGVRVVTVNGVLITTDKHGRFSVPCAELPDPDIGSNFILKLDTRTLPDGYKVTTENPRVVRLTAGKATKLNFGATAGATIRVAVTGRAFKKGAVQPSTQLADGISRLGAVSDKGSSILKVTYTASGEAPELIEARVAAVKALIAKVWRESGRKLPFEIRVVGVE